MSVLARIAEGHHDDVAVAAVHGEIDASNAPEIGERLRSLVTNRSAAMVVDLTGTTYLDSAGINLLFALGEQMSGRQQALVVVVADRSPIARMLSITALDRTVTVEGTLADALDAVRPPAP